MVSINHHKSKHLSSLLTCEQASTPKNIQLFLHVNSHAYTVVTISFSWHSSLPQKHMV